MKGEYNMKSYINKLLSPGLAFCALLAMSSCGDFLQIEPKTFVSEDNFWNEKTDIDQMVAGVYVRMQNDNYMRRCVVWGEVRSDNTAEGLDAAKYTNLYRILKENLLSTNEFSAWVDFYAVINQCNTIIEKAPLVSEKDPTYTLSDVRATQAEMAFLRDLSYFYLVRAFKDVPYYTYSVQSEEDVAPIEATSGDVIVPALIEDLESQVSYALKAYPKDSNSNYNSNCNRVTQNAIYALLADLCLWNGDYQKCVEYSQKVIDAKYTEYQENYAGGTSMSRGSVVLFQNPNDTYSKGFPLYSCFSGNSYGNDFNNIFGGSQNSFESIFELAFTNNGSDPNYLANTAMADLYGNYYTKDGNKGHGFIAVDEKIVSDLAITPEGTIFDHRYDERYYTSLYNEKFSNNEFNEAYVGKYVYTQVSIEPATSMTMPYVPYFVSSIVANRNFIFYRLTDVMLMQAQALIELGDEVVDATDDSSNPAETHLDDNLTRAFYLIWAVNRRSIMTNSATASSSYALNLNKYNHKPLLEELVLNERRRELMFEGKRWFDLLRLCHRDGNTSAIRSRVSAKGANGGSLFTNYESLYWPYNKREVKNNPKLSQKPYYGSDDDDESFKSTK